MNNHSDELNDRRLEFPHLFPGYDWYLAALKVELGKPATVDLPIWWEYDIRTSFCKNIAAQLKIGNKVHVLSWDDAKRFNIVAVPGVSEVNRNGDWIFLKTK